MTVEIGC